ncbi:hypothetical protein M514_21814, partial [Trichuris suis]
CVDVTSKKHLAFCPKYNFFRGRCRPSQTFLLLYRLDLRNTNVKAFITDIHPVQIFATTKVCEAFGPQRGPSSAPKFSSCSPPGPAIEELSSVSPADVDIPVKSKLDSSRLTHTRLIDPQTVQSSNHLLAAQQINNHPVAEHLWGRLTNMHCPLECDQIIWSTRYSLLYVFSATRHFSYQEPDAAFRSTFAYGQYGNLDRYDRKRIYFLA